MPVRFPYVTTFFRVFEIGYYFAYPVIRDFVEFQNLPQVSNNVPSIIN